MVVPGHSQPAEGSTSLPSSSGKSSSHLNGGAIAGVVIGVIAAFLILAALFFIMGRNKVYREFMSQNKDPSGDVRAARYVVSNSGPYTTDYKEQPTISYLSSPSSGPNAVWDGSTLYPLPQGQRSPPSFNNEPPPRPAVELEACQTKGRVPHRSELDCSQKSSFRS